MKYVFLLILLAKCMYLAVPNITVRPFLHATGEMREITLFTYVWAFVDILTIFLVGLIGWLMLSGEIKKTPDRVNSFGAFVVVCGLDFADYVLRGNSEWFYIGPYPVTNNVLMMAVYAVSLIIFTGKHDIDTDG